MNRRNFIKSSCATCAGSIGVLWLLQACGAGKYITAANHPHNKISVKKTDFIQVKKGKNVYQKFVLVKPENLPFPIALYQLNNGNYTAAYLQCTHQGCELTAHETAMVCPCHGAEFNVKGEVTQGPAEVNLKLFNTTHDTENIYIQL